MSDITQWASGGTSTAPSNAYILQGFVAGESPASANFNWIIQELVNYTDTQVANMGTGVDTTGASAGDIAYYNGASVVMDTPLNVIGNATETAHGLIQLATQVEVDAGIDDTKSVTPLKLKTRLDALIPSGTTDGEIIEWDTTANAGAGGWVVSTKPVPKPLTTNIVVTVGTGGDYATINEALEYIDENYSPIFQQGVFNVSAEINLLSGFVMAEQVLVNGRNLGWVKITSIDPIVNVVRNSLTILFKGVYPAFLGYNNSVLPVISTVFSMDSTGVSTNRIGILVYGGGSVFVDSGSGFINSPSSNMFATSSSTIIANGAVATGGGIGIQANFGSTISASLIDVSNCSNYGVYCDTNSSIGCNGINASSCGIAGIFVANASNLTALNSTITGNTNWGVIIDSSSNTILNGSDCSLNGIGGVIVQNGSSAICVGVNARSVAGFDNVADFYCNTGSNIVVNKITNDATYGTALGGTNTATNTLSAAGVIYNY